MMPFELPPLPYEYNALEPYLNEETLRFHHDKHHAAYVNALNEAEEKLAKAQESDDFSTLRAICNAMAFNYSGHLLHTLFWNNMGPTGGGEPQGALADQINRDFKSFDTFKAQFIAAANQVQGSGWALLCWQPLGEKLVILQTEKHQDMAQWGAQPILVLDVWEHAYYLQYQNKRPDFTKGFFDVVNWQDVAERFQQARQIKG